MKSGASAQFEKTVSEADLALYLGLSGDELPAYLVTSPGRRRLAPSTLALGYISSAFARLTEACAQSAVLVTRYQVTFPAPLHVGETLTTSVTVVDGSHGQGDVTVAVRGVTDAGRLVVDGRAYFRIE